MSKSIGLFDPSIGIQSVIQTETELSAHMPESRPLAQNTVQQPGLDALYGQCGLDAAVIQFLQPPVGDGEILRPDRFNGLLRDVLESLGQTDDPDVSALVGLLDTVGQDTTLLRMYSGLVVAG